MPDRRDAYKILGVPPTATTDTIERAFRELAREYHPDLNPSPDATARMQDINWARDTLTDPRKRFFHDFERRAPQTRTYTPHTTTQQRPRTSPQQRRTTTSRSQQQRTTYTPPQARTRQRTAPQPQRDTSWRQFGCGVWLVLLAIRALLAWDWSPDSPSYQLPPNYGATLQSYGVDLDATYPVPSVFLTSYPDFAETWDAEIGQAGLSTPGGPTRTPYPTVRPMIVEWNRIDTEAERVHYQQILDDVSKPVEVQAGGYVGRYNPPGAVRYYCPPDPVGSGPPLTPDLCTQFFSKAPDMGLFDD